MYRRGTILARTISIELTLRRSSSEIAAGNRDRSRVTAIGLNPGRIHPHRVGRAFSD
jgi:hypothetical protein